MKCNKIFCTLALGIIPVLLLVAFPAIPTHATGAYISLNPDEGEIGDRIEINGSGFNANETVRLYFSSDEAKEGDNIDGEVTAYEIVNTASTNAVGNFGASFIVPAQLTDGKERKMCMVANTMFMPPISIAKS